MTISASMRILVTAEYGVVSREHIITVTIEDSDGRGGSIETMAPKEVVELITCLQALLDACQEDA